LLGPERSSLYDRSPSCHPAAGPLDELVIQLLDCGGALSQIISRMVSFQAAGRSAPDSAPIPETAHSIIRDVVDGVRKRHSKWDIKVAAAIVKEATAALCDDIFFVGPELN